VLTHTGLSFARQCYVLYDKPFWRENGFSGEVLTTSPPLCLYYDATNHRSLFPLNTHCNHSLPERLRHKTIV